MGVDFKSMTSFMGTQKEFTIVRIEKRQES